MPSKAIVVRDVNNNPITEYEAVLSGVTLFCNNNPDGYLLYNSISAGSTYVRIIANNMKPAVHAVVLDDQNQEIHFGASGGPDNTIHFPALSFSKPSSDVIRQMKGNFGGIIVPELQFGFPNKVLFTPGYVVESENIRQIIRARYIDSGFTHFPINTYSDSSIYHDVYPNWDDSQINQFLEELLDDDLIPVCSLFADNSKTLKNNISPDLVLSGFVGWENKTPILRPALDADNLFYIAKQTYPNALIYWHNPSYQGAPYVNALDWGRTADAEVNDLVWQYMVNKSGCQGLLNQGNGWENNAITSINRLGEFRQRLILGQDGWPIADLIDFEQTVLYLTEMNGNPLLATEWSQAVRNSCEGLTGYCNG